MIMMSQSQNEYQNPNPGEVEEYLKTKNLDYYTNGEEIQFPCPHGDCDTNREHPNMKNFHCSINVVTGQYHCVKCGQSGNLTTLKRLFGDTSSNKPSKKSYASTLRNPEKIAKACHDDMVSNHREYVDYFTKRGISLTSMNSRRFGCGEFYHGKMWLTIPIEENDNTFLKLRRPPEEEDREPKYMVYPKGSVATVYGGDELLKSSSDSVLICGGELDKIIADQMNFGMPAISSTAGESTFKEAWIDKYLKGRRNIFICFDADNTGKDATESLAKLLMEKCPKASIFRIIIPENLGEHADLTDANLAGVTAKQLLESAEYLGGTKPINKDEFTELSIADLSKTLSLTIKHDDVNKAVIFLAMLSTYTEEDQLNVFLNARSSSGKSYLVQEVSKYFPSTDILVFGKVSPTAFYYNEEIKKVGDDGVVYIDLERKILIFLDQVNFLLQENLRSLLSHDEKRLPFLTTNKNKKGSNTAETIYLLGFPSSFFCSANMKMDEQEQTRAFLLSPEITQEKLEDGVDLAQLKMGNKTAFNKMLNENKERQLLIDRVYYIKELGIKEIVVPEEFKVAERFKKMFKQLQPRSQRDIQHLNSLIKAVTLLNAPFRMASDGVLVAQQSDVDQAFDLWVPLNRSQKYGVSPQALDFYEQIILPAFKEAKTSLTMKNLHNYNLKATGAPLNQNFCRNQYISVLESAGLISYEKNPENGREMLITPLILELDTAESSNGKTNEEGDM